MIPLVTWIVFVLACIALVATPGPNVLYLVSRTLAQGRAAGFVSVAGTSTGFLFHVLTAAFGLSAILAAVPVAYDAIRLAGALYLAWLAWSTWRSPDFVAGAGNAEPIPAARLFRDGIVTAVLNPKVAMFQLAFFPQFVDPSRGSVLVQSLLLGATQLGIAVVGDSLFVLAAAGVRRWFNAAPRMGPLVQASSCRRLRRAGGAPRAGRTALSALPARIYGKLVLMAVFWGGTYIAGRIATAEMAPPAAALWRYLIASVALLGVAVLLEGGLPRLSGQQWLGVTLLGATGVALFNLCFMYGLARVSASRASLIVALNPAATLIGAALFLREPLTRNKSVGIVVALVGVSVVLGHGDPRALVTGSVSVGDILLFGCPVAWAAYALLGQRILRGLSPVAATTYAALIGTAMLAVVAAFTGDLGIPGVSWRAWAAVGFIGVFGTAWAFVWFYEGVRAIGPARAAVFINLVPVAAITLGVLLLGEPLELSMLVGGALVVAGIWILNRPQSAPPVPVASAG